MRNALRVCAGVALALSIALPAAAATASEFYLTMLRRGVSAYDAGRFDAAVGPLKTAAFGLVDSVEHYQTAQIHLALAHDRLGNAELAREAARRVVVGQRVEARYNSLPLAQATRTNFESLANKYLTPAEIDILGGSTKRGPAQPAQTAGASSAPAPSNDPPAPKAEPPTPRVEQPKVEQPKVEQPKAEQPKAEQPKAEQPKVEQPKAEQPKVEQPKVEQPKVEQPKVEQPKVEPPVASPPAHGVPARLAAAERALGSAQLPEARAIYRELLQTPSLDRPDLLRLAEGLYRSRDFANVLRAFDRAGALRRGEEPYRYYIAVALYETAQYAKAKEQLAAVLPFIEETPDVTRYRAKIEGAVN